MVLSRLVRRELIGRLINKASYRGAKITNRAGYRKGSRWTRSTEEFERRSPSTFSTRGFHLDPTVSLRQLE